MGEKDEIVLTLPQATAYLRLMNEAHETMVQALGMWAKADGLIKLAVSIVPEGAGAKVNEPSET